MQKDPYQVESNHLLLCSKSLTSACVCVPLSSTRTDACCGVIRARLFFRPFGCLPADFADLVQLLLPFWPRRAQKAHLATVTAQIKSNTLLLACYFGSKGE